MRTYHSRESKMAKEKIKHLFAYISDEENAINEQDKSIEFIVSTDKLDRHNDIVEAQAVLDAIKRPGEFSANPVALACHLHRLSDGMPPAIGSWDVESAKATKHKVSMRLHFAIDTKLGEEYWKLYSKRHMRAVSIGFHIIDDHEVNEGGVRYWVITKIELYEISAVAVGANPDALSRSIAAWFNTDNFNERDIDKYGEDFKRFYEISQLNASKLDSIEESIEDLKLLSIANAGGLAESMLGTDTEQAHPAGEKDKTEQIVKAVKKISHEVACERNQLC